ncbi:MAG: hypothetical protein H6827_10855 [Planctomycetes bacterium]|nr:hypothetical protein [Planctomycetota bacterium]
MDPSTGRFVSEDPYEGSGANPVSQHRFVYGNSSPIELADPSGNSALALLAGESGAAAISGIEVIYNALIIAIFAKAIYDIEKTGISSPVEMSPQMRAKLNKPDNVRRAREQQQELRKKWGPIITEAESKGQKFLFHYSDKEAVAQIYLEQYMYVTEAYTRPVVRPRGAYATDIAPWDPGFTQYSLAQAIFFNPMIQKTKDVSWFVALKRDGFSRARGSREWYKEPASGESIVKVDPVEYGKNPMPAGYP